ncbi:MAG: hypothetical protein ACKO2P_13855 [Planctomycetota bacterium]
MDWARPPQPRLQPVLLPAKVSEEISGKFDQINKSADTDQGEAASDLATPQKSPTAAELSELAKQIQAEREKLEQIQKAMAAAKKAGGRKKKENAQQSSRCGRAEVPCTVALVHSRCGAGMADACVTPGDVIYSPGGVLVF